MAIIEISGELELERSPGSVKARIRSLFEPPARPAPAADPKAADRARAGERAARPRCRDRRGQGLYRQGPDGPAADSVPIDDAGRLQRIFTRELVLARRQADGRRQCGVERRLADPRGPPDRRRGQFLVVYDDPQGRFHFRHPQELEITKQRPGCNSSSSTSGRAEGGHARPRARTQGSGPRDRPQVERSASLRPGPPAERWRGTSIQVVNGADRLAARAGLGTPET